MWQCSRRPFKGKIVVAIILEANNYDEEITDKIRLIVARRVKYHNHNV